MLNNFVTPKSKTETPKRLVELPNNKFCYIPEEFESYEEYQQFIRSISKINGKSWFLYDFTKDFDCVKSFLNTKGRVLI